MLMIGTLQKSTLKFRRATFSTIKNSGASGLRGAGVKVIYLISFFHYLFFGGVKASKWFRSLAVQRFGSRRLRVYRFRGVLLVEYDPELGRTFP